MYIHTHIHAHVHTQTLQKGDMCKSASEDPSYNVLVHHYEESVPSNPDHDFPAYAMLREVIRDH